MPDKLQIKFKKKTYHTLLDYIVSLDKTSNGLEIDNTGNQNLRYVGPTPNNYVSFNNEIWRIIGIFNVYNNDDQREEKLVKIIRNDSLGNYSWDTSTSSINSGYGINEWSQAKLMKELNTDYIDISKTSGSTKWYNGQNNKKTATYNYDNNINSNFIDKIANVRWDLGGINSSISGTALTIYSVNTIYTLERGTIHISNPSDKVTRTDTWDGKIALMYPSDYGYASTNSLCRNNLSSINNSIYNCKNNNWIFNNNIQWTLTPFSNNARDAFRASSSGAVSNEYIYLDLDVRPTIFLKSDVQILSGTGTSDDPYIIN